MKNLVALSKGAITRANNLWFPCFHCFIKAFDNFCTSIKNSISNYGILNISNIHKSSYSLSQVKYYAPPFEKYSFEIKPV